MEPASIAGDSQVEQPATEAPLVPNNEQQRQRLPDNVLHLVVHQAILNRPLILCLELRLVSRDFAKEVLHRLFNFFLINQKIMRTPIYRHEINRQTAERYWFSFINSRDPLRSFLGENYPTQYPQEGYAPWVFKQSKRLRTLHKKLNDAVDDCLLDGDLSLLRQQLSVTSVKELDTAHSKIEYEVKRMSCLANLCKTAVFLLGPEFAWNYIHPIPQLYMSLQAYHLRYEHPFQYFYTHRLLNKPSSFWRMLYAVYRGNTEQLQTHLEHLRVRHRDPDDWIRRLNSISTYHTQSSHYSPKECRWLEALSACLTVAVSSGNLELAKFLLKQDVAIDTETFRTISFNELSPLFLTIRNGFVQILDTLIGYGWLDSLSGNVLDNDVFKRALLSAVGMSKEAPNRSPLLWSLIRIGRNSVQDVRSLLRWAASRNDVDLANFILSIEQRPSPSERALLIPASPVELSPLVTGALAGHREITSCLLDHAQRLRRTIIPQTRYQDLITITIKEMFRANLYRPINEEILNDLLNHTRHQRLEQIQAIIDDPHNAIDILRKFFEQVDATTTLTSDDNHTTETTTTLGEHALLYAVYTLDVPCTQYLVEDKKVRISEKKTVTLPDNASETPSRRKSSFVLEHEAEIDVRRMLAKYDMVASKDRTRIWPRP